jgi:hypothetical protein
VYLRGVLRQYDGRDEVRDETHTSRMNVSPKIHSPKSKAVNLLMQYVGWRWKVVVSVP